MNQNYFYKPYQPRNLQKIPCSVCGSEEFRSYASENNLSIVACASCGYILVNPRPCLEDLEAFYEEYYPDQDGLPESWGGEMSDIFSSAYRDIVAVRQGGSILDIGSSYGHFLSQFDPEKWRLFGIDPSSRAVGYCREHYPHITAYSANFEDVSLEPESFDVITSFYVLEHVFDPRAVMQRIHGLLRKGGRAVIRIPYTRPFFPFARLLRRPLMYAPMHLNDFAPNHFEQMCRSLGFAQVQSTVGARRNSTDMVEKLGAALFGGAGRCYEIVTRGKSLFPYAGAYTYLLEK